MEKYETQLNQANLDLRHYLQTTFSDMWTTLDDESLRHILKC